jgi:hypothetical protein
LKELNTLFLSATNLSGPLPESFKHLPKLDTVHFFGANLEGPIFDFILTWPSISKSVLHLGRQFCDTASNSCYSSVCHLVSQETINLGQSSFTGVLPTEIGTMTNIGALALKLAVLMQK